MWAAGLRGPGETPWAAACCCKSHALMPGLGAGLNPEPWHLCCWPAGPSSRSYFIIRTCPAHRRGLWSAQLGGRMPLDFVSGDIFAVVLRRGISMSRFLFSNNPESISNIQRTCPKADDNVCINPCHEEEHCSLQQPCPLPIGKRSALSVFQNLVKWCRFTRGVVFVSCCCRTKAVPAWAHACSEDAGHRRFPSGLHPSSRSCHAA